MPQTGLTHIEQMLALKSRYLMPCVYHFYREPMVLERGQGCRLYDSSGCSYLDCYSGVGVNSCGHGQTSIIERTSEQLHKLSHTTTIYITEPMLRLAEALAHFIPGNLTRSFFCSSGSEANEGALLLAKLATGRNEFVSLSCSLHGRTALTMGVTGIEFWRADPAPPTNVHFAHSPTCSACPLHLTHPDCGLKCVEEVEAIFDANPGRIAAFIAEPVHGNGGIVVPPPGYFERIQAILRRHGALLIMDEAQTGFCRTGQRFGHAHWDVQPDIMTMCKALGNGLPIAAFIATDEVAAHYTRPGASTFGGNLVCAASALATLDFMTEHELEHRSKSNGAHLKQQLQKLGTQHPMVGQVRGLGLMLGMEIVRQDGAPDPQTMDLILESMKNKGFLIGKTGPDRNVLTLMPPLIITPAEIDTLTEALDITFRELNPFKEHF